MTKNKLSIAPPDKKKTLEAFFRYYELSRLLFGQKQNEIYDVTDIPKTNKFYELAKEIAKQLEIDWENMTHEESNRVMLALLEDSFNLIRDIEDSKSIILQTKIVIKKWREGYLQFISLMYLDLYRKLKHIGTGKLITAVPVDKETEDRIRSAAAHILHAQMELETVIDPSIEGGFIFDINDYRLDASVATQLKRVKQQFIDKNRRIV